MNKISDIFTKNYFKIFLFFFIFHVFINAANFYIFNKVINNNINVVANFIKSVSTSFEKNTIEKVNHLKNIYPQLRQYVLKNKNISAKQLANYIKLKYNLNFDTAFISEKGIITDTTFQDELGFDLSQFEDAKVAFQSVKSSKHFRVDFPVLNTSDYFYLYLLDFIENRKQFLQLGYKLDLLNEIKNTFANLKSIKDIDYNLNIIHFFKQNEFKLVSLNQDNVEEIIPVFKNLFEKGKYDFFEKKFYSFKMLKIFNFNINMDNPYGIAYVLKVKLLNANQFIIFMIILNLLTVFLYFWIYKKYYMQINNLIVKPLESISNSISKSKPLFKNNYQIKELEDINKAYDEHLKNIKLRDYVGELIKAQEQEREKIAKNIHDSVLQDLNYILFQLQNKKEEELSEIVGNSINQLRNIIKDNLSSMLKLIGYKGMLQNMIYDFQSKYTDFNFDLVISGCENQKKKDYLKYVNILMAIKEIINNSVKHSGGNNVLIRIFCNNNLMKILIEDNGKGFDVDKKFAETKGFGLFSIRERIYLCHGKMEIISNNKGTKYLIEIDNEQNN